MARERVTIGDCPKCDGDQLACSYNYFEKADLTIHSWEHKCPNCGFRDTTAYRSDEEEEPEEDEPVDPATCPYCGRRPNSATA